jgi:hypothetical protein
MAESQKPGSAAADAAVVTGSLSSARSLRAQHGMVARESVMG